MGVTHHIADLDDLAGFEQAVHAAWAKSKPLNVEILGDRRRDIQSRLQHKWYDVVAAKLEDRTSLSVKCETKLHIGVPIIRAGSEPHNEFFRALWEPIEPLLNYQLKFRFMGNVKLTSKFSPEEASQYIDEMREYWHDNAGIYLTTPKWASTLEQYDERYAKQANY